MSDGIIQKVNQEIQSMIDFRSKVTPYDIQTWLNLYQQELIEKMKKAYMRHEIELHYDDLMYIIGDNNV